MWSNRCIRRVRQCTSIKYLGRRSSISNFLYVVVFVKYEEYSWVFRACILFIEKYTCVFTTVVLEKDMYTDWRTLVETSVYCRYVDSNISQSMDAVDTHIRHITLGPRFAAKQKTQNEVCLPASLPASLPACLSAVCLSFCACIDPSVYPFIHSFVIYCLFLSLHMSAFLHMICCFSLPSMKMPSIFDMIHMSIGTRWNPHHENDSWGSFRPVLQMAPQTQRLALAEFSFPPWRTMQQADSVGCVNAHLGSSNFKDNNPHRLDGQIMVNLLTSTSFAQNSHCNEWMFVHGEATNESAIPWRARCLDLTSHHPAKIGQPPPYYCWWLKSCTSW